MNTFVSSYPAYQDVPNQVYFPSGVLQQAAPLLAWQFGSGAITWNSVYAAAHPTDNTLSLAVDGSETDLNWPLTWITAEAVVVPAPLPLLGGAAAFQWSHRLGDRARA